MEWLIGSILVPIIIWLWSVYKDRKTDYERNEERFYELESRVTVTETKIEAIEHDVTEIQKINDKLDKVSSDLIRVITILDERTTKHKGP